VLRDEELEYILQRLQSDSEQNLSDSGSDIENELEDRALLDTVENDDSAIQAFVWQNMDNYRGQRENFTGSVGAQGAAKHVRKLWMLSSYFSTQNLLTPLSHKQTDTRSTSYVGVNYQSSRLLGHGNL
jgi:hypothetical protein